MKIDEALKILKMEMPGSVLDEDIHTAEMMAIKSLEMWTKAQKEIDDSISACESDAMRDIWCNGEHVGFIESQDIIERCIEELEDEDDSPESD